MTSAVVIFIFVCLLRNTLSEVLGTTDFESTTKDYDADTSGDSFRITEDGTFWRRMNNDRSATDHRSFNSGPSDYNAYDKPKDLNKITLKEFLEMYAKKQNQRPEYSEDNTAYNLDKLIQDQDGKISSNDNSKSWELLDVQKHKHPFEDKKGWVSLEPIPWSVSKISKWQSKYKPVSDRPWDENGPISSQRPYLHEDDFDFKRPVSITPPSPYIYHQPSTESSDRYDSYYDQVDRPRPTPSSSIYPRPTAYFGHKVHVEAHFPSNSYTSTGKPHTYHKHNKDCQHSNNPYDEIMTDGLPSNFPKVSAYESLRRRGTEMEIHPETHPMTGEGEWVLLSTTKGYKPPRSRQRSLDVGATSDPLQSLRATRGIRLTVLPPLKGSKVNMTTSHGGLLQVESTFESVEQAKNEYDKKQKRLKIKGQRKRRKGVKKPNKTSSEGPVQTVATTVPRANNDPGAVMAAVGAGMIPATMAMMVPIAMSGG